MPVLQIILNLPFLVPGFGMKILFFSQKGMGREYVAGITPNYMRMRKIILDETERKRQGR